eukprot:TRINITY_DN5054_c0_g1_i2.p1 TRINITY_DN5054_c0_g1~~TRINITY_DN5054_c0_g1_i2.p1  ORF type:complete len:384 (-),score=75.56 TRINITY_DN5054_c0_g1_i2:63-1214(-)
MFSIVHDRYYTSQTGIFPRCYFKGDTLHIEYVLPEMGEIDTKTINDDPLVGEISFKFHNEKLIHIEFPKVTARFRLERLRMRYSSQEDTLYFSTCSTGKQDYTEELDELDGHLMIDFDANEKVIGFAILQAKQHIDFEIIKPFPDHKWVNFESSTPDDQNNVEGNNTTVDSVDSTKQVIQKPKKVQQPRQKKPPPKKQHKMGDLLPKPNPITKPAHHHHHQVSSLKGYYWNMAIRHLYWVLYSPKLLKVLSPESVTEELKWLDESVRNTQVFHPSQIPPQSSTSPESIDFSSVEELLAKLDNDPSHFYKWISTQAARSHILGGYFALLVQYWMTYFPHITKNHPKFQIFEGKRTIGDLDFLFFDTNVNGKNHRITNDRSLSTS